MYFSLLVVIISTDVRCKRRLFLNNKILNLGPEQKIRKCALVKESYNILSNDFGDTTIIGA